jgi:hypothetical protein
LGAAFFCPPSRCVRLTANVRRQENHLMRDAVFVWGVLGLLAGGLVLYAFWSRDKVRSHGRAGWALEIGGFALALVGGTIAFAGGPIPAGAALVLVGLGVGLAGLYLFTRNANE